MCFCKWHHPCLFLTPHLPIPYSNNHQICSITTRILFKIHLLFFIPTTTTMDRSLQILYAKALLTFSTSRLITASPDTFHYSHSSSRFFSPGALMCSALLSTSPLSPFLFYPLSSFNLEIASSVWQRQCCIFTKSFHFLPVAHKASMTHASRWGHVASPG